MSHKSTVLLVHSQLAQHGSERLLYELARLLTGQGHSVYVQTRPFFIKRQHYYPLLCELGVGIHRTLITRRHFSYLLRRIGCPQWVYEGCLKYLLECLYNFLTVHYYRKFDNLVFIGLETYCDSLGACGKSLELEAQTRVMHVMHKFQQDRDYLSEYRLKTLVCAEQVQVKEVYADRPDLETLVFTLPISVSEPSNSYQRPKSGSVIKLVVVSSLEQHRPNEIVFRYFAHVQSRFPVELHWFGGGDISRYKNIAAEIGCETNKIIFHGHVSNITERFDEIRGACFLQTAMLPTMNYAPIEIMLSKRPVFLININSDAEGILPELPVINDVRDMEGLCEVLMDEGAKIHEIIANNYEYVREVYSSSTAYERFRLVLTQGVGASRA